MTPEQAADLAARTLAVIDAWLWKGRITQEWADYCRERVASDLAAIERAHVGLRTHRDDGDGWCYDGHEWSFPCQDHLRYWDAADDALAGLRRTAALYGVAEQHRHQPGWPCHNPRCPDA